MKVRSMTIKEVAEEENASQQYIRIGLQRRTTKIWHCTNNATEVKNTLIIFQQKSFSKKKVDQYQVNI